ncbi:hypothetical protein BDY19DRAFT_996518 [Irpex rosettiformis]|uniref:Uncharacterized protein n=1 Tax=Irpex rosettiformis TaxID=378272 RepID=A0ACB8TU59_9APHY|nr:hypothetical protein BDY19DRAFT_996518 [Irpex rosettiformis]
MTPLYSPPLSPRAVKRKWPANGVHGPSVRSCRSRTMESGFSVFSSVLPGDAFVNAGPSGVDGSMHVERSPPFLSQSILTESATSATFSFKLDDIAPSWPIPESFPTAIPALPPSLSVLPSPSILAPLPPSALAPLPSSVPFPLPPSVPSPLPLSVPDPLPLFTLDPPSPFVPDPPSPSINKSLTRLTQETHARAAAQLQSKQDNSQTGRSYSRHVRNYEKFWVREQQTRAAADSTWVDVPAFPITATKVALFLDYEMKRPKLKPNQQIEPGATVGKYHIQQAISALEDWRTKNVHRFPDEREMLQPFRTDWRISQLESLAKSVELQRVANAQTLKAAGGFADTYTTEEVLKCSLFFITDRGTGRQHIFVSLRDRAMFLIAAQSAFRGESSRILLWSDCYQQIVPMNDVHIGFKVPVLGMMALNAKHNQHGRLDEHGVMRHTDTR